MNIIFWNKRNEFRLIWFYIPLVVMHGIISNLHTPILEVVWDSVFYKSLAFGLHNISSFDLNKHFPVPPFYPFLISVGFFAPDYLTVELIQSWINPAIYFLGLFPMYAYSRRMLKPSDAVFVCLIYAIYPSAAYTQWTMSENLAAPLVIWSALSVSRILTDQRPRVRDGAFLGMAIAGLILTRIFLIVYCATALGWVVYRTVKHERDPAPPLMAFGMAFSITITAWWQLGYFTREGTQLLYASFNNDALPSSFALFVSIFSAHWTGLWLEGGLLITGFMIVHWLVAWLLPDKLTQTSREITYFAFITAIALTVTVAVYYVKRMGIEPWSISLRYIFYINLICLPIFAASLGALHKASRNERILRIGALIIIIPLLAASLLIPEAWSKLSNNHEFLANAPSLDFIYQMRNMGALNACKYLIGASLIGGIICLFCKRTGMVISVVIILFIQLSAVDFIMQTRTTAIETYLANEIHDFCREVEQKKWGDTLIYCEENGVQLLSNMNYWLNHPAGAIKVGGDLPPAPFLLLTVHEHEGDELVFQSGKLKAYLYEKE